MSKIYEPMIDGCTEKSMNPIKENGFDFFQDFAAQKQKSLLKHNCHNRHNYQIVTQFGQVGKKGYINWWYIFWLSRRY